MSHIVQIQTEVRDAAAIGAACHRLGLPEPVFGEACILYGRVMNTAQAGRACLGLCVSKLLTASLEKMAMSQMLRSMLVLNPSRFCAKTN